MAPNIIFSHRCVNQVTGILSVFLSLPQWDFKFYGTFEFVISAFTFIFVTQFIKINISTTWPNKIMEHRLLITNYRSSHTHTHTYTYFHLHSHYINVSIFFIKFRTFDFILKNYATLATDMHFSSQYMISEMCLAHIHSLYAVLTGRWCLENDTSS
jgi:hypothetical protein